MGDNPLGGSKPSPPPWPAARAAAPPPPPPPAPPQPLPARAPPLAVPRRLAGDDRHRLDLLRRRYVVGVVAPGVELLQLVQVEGLDLAEQLAPLGVIQP